MEPCHVPSITMIVSGSHQITQTVHVSETILSMGISGKFFGTDYGTVDRISIEYVNIEENKESFHTDDVGANVEVVSGNDNARS